MNPNRRTAVMVVTVACCLGLVAGCGSDSASTQRPATGSSSPSDPAGANGGGDPGSPGVKPGGGDKGGPPPGHDATVPPDVQGGEQGAK